MTRLTPWKIFAQRKTKHRIENVTNPVCNVNSRSDGHRVLPRTTGVESLIYLVSGGQHNFCMCFLATRHQWKNCPIPAENGKRLAYQARTHYQGISGGGCWSSGPRKLRLTNDTRLINGSLIQACRRWPPVAIDRDRVLIGKSGFRPVPFSVFTADMLFLQET
jgi:hypothetical protein